MYYCAIEPRESAHSSRHALPKGTWQYTPHLIYVYIYIHIHKELLTGWLTDWMTEHTHTRNTQSRPFYICFGCQYLDAAQPFKCDAWNWCVQEYLSVYAMRSFLLKQTRFTPPDLHIWSSRQETQQHQKPTAALPPPIHPHLAFTHRPLAQRSHLCHHKTRTRERYGYNVTFTQPLDTKCGTSLKHTFFSESCVPHPHTPRHHI